MRERKKRLKLEYGGDNHRESRKDFDGRKQYLPPDPLMSKKQNKKGVKKGLLAEQDSLLDENFDPTGTPFGLLSPLHDDGFSLKDTRIGGWITLGYIL